MVVEFFDRQEDDNPLNGSKIATSVALSRTIDQLRNRRPFFFELLGENGYKLLIGVGKHVGCVQYSACDGNPPYLVATTGREMENNTYIEFLAGNTPTPIPRHYCVPFDVMKRIAALFMETGLRDTSIQWEEVGPPPT
jgi:hypothetical protein